ncbi:MAG: hypothetical protein ACLFTB_09530 [Desulfovibrionales bacterium]
MANCTDMKKGDVYTCTNCNLELKVEKPCTCQPGAEGQCTVPLQCCGQDMVKK